MEQFCARTIEYCCSFSCNNTTDTRLLLLVLTKPLGTPQLQAKHVPSRATAAESVLGEAGSKLQRKGDLSNE